MIIKRRDAKFCVPTNLNTKKYYSLLQTAISPEDFAFTELPIFPAARMMLRSGPESAK